MESPSVVVVGAGAVGLSVAFHLAHLGADRVTVVDKAHVASGSSGLSVGIVETQYLEPLDIELRVFSGEFFDSLEREHDLQIVRNGYLRLANSEDEVPLFEESIRVQRALGIRDARVLDAAGVKEAVPDLRCDDVVAGLFGPNDGYIDGHLYCNLLRDIVIGQGVEVLTRAALIGEEPGTERRHRIITTQDEIECDFVVNAAGPWAGEVGEILGAPVSQLPQRHQVVVAHLTRPLDYVMPSVMDYVPGSGEYGFYCRYESPLQLFTGLHTEEPLLDVVDPNTYNRSVDNEFLELVAEKFARRLPELRDAEAGSRLGRPIPRES